MRARGWAVVAAAAVALTGLVDVALGFEHHIHERDLAVKGDPDLPCTRCHQVRAGTLVGRPDHTSCTGSTCHAAAPSRPRRGQQLVVAADQRELCASCHDEATVAQPITGRLAVSFPPYVANDFALVARHQRHRVLECATCHPRATLADAEPRRATPAKPTRAKPGRAHQRCVGCHDGSGRADRGPAMTACAGCHEAAGGSPIPPSLAVPLNTVTSTFSHPRHAVRGGTGARCDTCHAAIRDTDDNLLPRPTAASCELASCHDGKAAFAITASCTRCHTTAPTGRYDLRRQLDVRFAHTTPAHAGAKLACVACHPLTSTGEVKVADHAPCAGCHAAEFGLREPTICFACHNSTEPWRRLVADRLPPTTTEFGATLDHESHRGACTTCHALRASGSQLRPPRGHQSCTTAGCHTVSGGPTPPMTACEQCHALGLAADRTAQRAAAPWSVRAQFDHDRHRRAPDGSEVACTRCHDDLTASSTANLATPRKSTCVSCHDGTTAFKVTGTGCARCHTGAAKPRRVAPALSPPSPSPPQRPNPSPSPSPSPPAPARPG